MQLLIQVTPEQIIDLNAITTASYFPPEDGHGKSTLHLSYRSGIVDKFYGETAAKLWALIQERTAPMEVF
jgi:hypothetical protein